MGLLDGGIEKQYFLFILEQRSFGVPVVDIVKVISVEKIHAVPLLSDFFWGFIIHENKPVPYINLKKKLGLGGPAQGDIGVLVQIGSELVGFSIDGGYEVIQLSEEPTPIPMEFKGVVKDLFKARGTIKNRNFIILNIHALAKAS
jgi:chemotaxis signal transduction protein